jgi:uncharacterized protein (DUF302 family)
MAYYSRKLKIPFQDVLNKVTETLKQQGFGIITSIDVQDTFRQKLNIGFRNYKILGACNPQLISYGGYASLQCCRAGT